MFGQTDWFSCQILVWTKKKFYEFGVGKNHHNLHQLHHTMFAQMQETYVGRYGALRIIEYLYEI